MDRTRMECSNCGVLAVDLSAFAGRLDGIEAKLDRVIKDGERVNETIEAVEALIPKLQKVADDGLAGLLGDQGIMGFFGGGR